MFIANESNRTISEGAKSSILLPRDDYKRLGAINISPLRGDADRLVSLYFWPLPSYFLLMTKCPTCGKPVEWKDNPWRPFCSERCKLIDFDKWTSDEYRVPGQRINPAEMPAQHSQSDVDNEDEES